MNDSVYRLIYTLLPCLVGAFAAAVFLTTRPISAARACVLGFLIAAMLTLGVTTVVGPGSGLALHDRAVRGLYIDFLGLFGSLYFIPAIVLVPTAVVMRARGVGRGIGIVTLIALFLASAWAGRLVSSHFDLVNAVQ
jgi:hypothetical protein